MNNKMTPYKLTYYIMGKKITKYGFKQKNKNKTRNRAFIKLSGGSIKPIFKRYEISG